MGLTEMTAGRDDREARALEIQEVMEQLHTGKTGNILNNERNLEIVLTRDPLFIKGLVFNEFSGQITWDGEELEDSHITEIRLGIGKTYQFTPSVPRAAELIAYCAKRRGSHPLRE